MRSSSRAPSIRSIRALPCEPSVCSAICQPAHDRASTPISCRAIEVNPLVTCSPVATTASYSRASCSGRQRLAPADQLVGDAGHRRYHHRHLVPGIHLPLHPARHVADAVEVGHRSAAKLHHDARHAVPAFLKGPVAADPKQGHIPAMAECDNLGSTQGRGPGGAASPSEVARFDALATEWWDPAGPMAPLHAMNPLRIGWITARLPHAATVLDVGCGAGLASEALARHGHTVLGIDAAPAPIAAARAHAAADAALAYRQATTVDLVAEHRAFAAITALEVIEHVPDPAGFLRDLAALLEPGGRVFVSTLNRTARSLVVAKWGAEYVLRLLPAGTHDWRRFVTPAELARLARSAGLRVTDSAGMSFSPLSQRWRISRDLAVNYIAMLER